MESIILQIKISTMRMKKLNVAKSFMKYKMFAVLFRFWDIWINKKAAYASTRKHIVTEK